MLNRLLLLIAAESLALPAAFLAGLALGAMVAALST
jgi:hypothetical protein